MKARRTLPASGDVIVVDANTARGYFSVTADIPAQRCGGMLHPDVLAAMPELAPIVALHLSDAQTGQPMHAEASGWYWLEGAAGGLGSAHHGGNDGIHSAADCERILADHLRVSLNEARGLVVAVLATTGGFKAQRAAFSAAVANMAGRWAQEAAEGRALLASLEAQQ